MGLCVLVSSTMPVHPRSYSKETAPPLAQLLNLKELIRSANAGGVSTAPVGASGGDPIFALIEEYRAAAKAVEAAASEVSCREEMIIEEGLGPYPVVCVIDRRQL